MDGLTCTKAVPNARRADNPPIHQPIRPADYYHYEHANTNT